jgi:hypothetical protein
MFFEASAKSGGGVSGLFDALAQRLMVMSEGGAGRGGDGGAWDGPVGDHTDDAALEAAMGRRK